MQTFLLSARLVIFGILVLAVPNPAMADAGTARQAMEDSQNPLFLIDTSQGAIYIELFPGEAPLNVQHFAGLAQGNIELVDTATGTAFKPRYYDGMRFHRAIPGFVIQAGSPTHNPLGAPQELLPDEINADFLGLDRMPVLNPDASFSPHLNIGDQNQFAETVLKPLYGRLRIETAEELSERQSEVLDALRQLTVKQVYENQGYRYNADRPTRAISRGVVALANNGPDSNGPEFFISLTNADWLNGRHTVIGKVVEGMDVADNIGNLAVDPSRFSRASTVIYSIRPVEQSP